jgi:hypothetical protein
MPQVVRTPTSLRLKSIRNIKNNQWGDKKTLGPKSLTENFNPFFPICKSDFGPMGSAPFGEFHANSEMTVEKFLEIF